MNVVLILTGGRSGADFLQSLLDGHNQILQFPGILKFDEKLIRLFNLKSEKNISKNFIKDYGYFFDSRFNKIERHHKLGKNKKSFYTVDKKKFIKKFAKYYNNSKKTNFDILVSLHKAYDNKCDKKKTLIIHIHLFQFLKNYIKYIGIKKNDKILLSFRDPLISLISTIKHWMRYRKGIDLTPRNLFSNLDLHFNNFNNLLFLKKKIRVVKLEKLHLHSEKTLKKICKYININYSKVLLKSTYHGKKWWGDSISKKYLNGLNRNFTNNFDKNFFTEKEILFFESKLFNIIKKYNYPFRSNVDISDNSLYLSPFSFEKKVWIKTLKLNSFKSILSCPIFYIKRFFLLKKNNVIDKDLPNEV